MATRSTISLVTEKGTVKTIYCHWDGYLSNNGKKLFEHYNTKELVNQLIQLGSLSSLHETITPTEGHTFEKPIEAICVAYHRDRGEELVINEFHSIENYVLALSTNRIGEEFNYIFKDGEWLFCTDKISYDETTIKSINDFSTLELALLTLPIKK